MRELTKEDALKDLDKGFAFAKFMINIPFICDVPRCSKDDTDLIVLYCLIYESTIDDTINLYRYDSEYLSSRLEIDNDQLKALINCLEDVRLISKVGSRVHVTDSGIKKLLYLSKIKRVDLSIIDAQRQN